MKHILMKHIGFLIMLVFQLYPAYTQESIEAYKTRLTAQELRQVDFTRPINITATEDRKYTLIFSDADKGQIIKTFDIRENNPFAELGSKTDNQYADVFSVENKTLGELFPDIYLHPSIYKRVIDDTVQIEGFYVDYGAKFSNNRQFAFVTYSAVPIPGEFNRTAFLFFDSTGVEISRHTLDLPRGQTLITDDGKYFAFATGWTSEHDYQTLIDDGFAVFSIKNGDLLLYHELNAIAGVFCENEFIVAGSHNYINYNESIVDYRYFVDMKNKRMFSREFKLDGLQDIETKSDGLTIYYRNGDIVRLDFLKDFKVEDF